MIRMKDIRLAPKLIGAFTLGAVLATGVGATGKQARRLPRQHGRRASRSCRGEQRMPVQGRPVAR
jgi:hypothetical protein